MLKNRKRLKIKTQATRFMKPNAVITSLKSLAFCLAMTGCLLFGFLLTPSTYSQPVTQKIQSNEQTFIKERAKIIGAFQKKTDALRTEIKAAEAQRAALKEEVDRLAKRLTTFDLWMLLFSLADFVGFFILLFFPLMVINHFIYLVIREKRFFERYKKPLVITFVTIEVLFFIPFSG